MLATPLSTRNNALFGKANCFIENKGQFGKLVTDHPEMGAILFGYEGLEMPVLFTSKGLVYLQRKVTGASEKDREEMERKERRQGRRKKEEEEIEARTAIDKIITMRWLNANATVSVVAEEQNTAYHTYASVQERAYGYKKIIYKDIYPGTDITFFFSQNKKAGFEYTVTVQPGANAALVKMMFGGDVTEVTKTAANTLTIRSAIGGIIQTKPVAFYGNDLLAKGNQQKVAVGYTVKNKQVGFDMPTGYDTTKPFVIDPFVTATGNLTGLNAGKGKDVDYDYEGNVYVTGGGSGATTHQLAKFNAAGVLQWTFNGTLTIPSWLFGTYWGGWMVEKPTGNVYLGQGFNPTTGFRVIRISTTGLYDNFITTANPSFREAWKMYWSCNNGFPQILVAGGGTNSNINFGVFVPPSTAIGSLNVTGIPYTGSAGWAQDIVDFIIDPTNNDMYTIYGSLFGNPSLTNKIYKNTYPYSGASVAWNVPSGFTSVQEIANRPYLAGGNIDNSANIFALNASYLFYWDGKNLKAFNKATGSGIGAPLVTSNTTLMQGGIVADACNNVFVGDGNGIIKVYKFTGAFFDDAAAPDITIPGFNGKAVYDLAFDESKKLLYASGNGFVASFDISSYCPTSQYTLTLVPDCATNSAKVTINPAPPTGSTVSFNLSIGSTKVATNTTGNFTGLQPNITYSVLATINQACSGSQATTTFILPAAGIAIGQSNTTCGNSTGAITATGSGTAGPYTYSLDGTNFQATGNFTGLAAGIYTITVKDANGCKNAKEVTIDNTNGPALTFTQTNADCGNNTGTITANASGGLTPYQYSVNGTNYQSGNFFTGLVASTYTLTVKDANGCTNSASVTITSSPKPLLNAIAASATCGSNNGTITAFGSGGTGALQYSINGNVFQVSNVFTNLTPGSYTVTVKDADGCTNTTSLTLPNSPAPTVTATSTPAACSNINGTITATGAGGIAPLQYSMDGINFQPGNIFTGLAAGSYSITVKDNTGCTNVITVLVNSTGGPIVTAVPTVSSCSSNNGTITVTASGGTGTYTYSINGQNYQVSKTFAGLAAGNYVVYVRDGGGCIGTVSITVGNAAGPALSATSVATACNANTGSIAVTATGGLPAYQYSINGTTYQPSNVFSGLATGDFMVYVKDANGCIQSTNIAITNVSGLSLAASSISSSCFNGGFITATATGGVAPLQFSINGTTYQPGNFFSGLTPGNYTAYVKDANNCIVTKPVTVASAGTLTLGVSSTDATCSSTNGILILTGNNGAVPLTYSLDGITYQTGGTFLNVAAGNYSVKVKDATGCIVSQPVSIANVGAGPGISTFTVVARNAYVCNQSLGRITNPRVNGANCNACTFSLDFGPFVSNSTQLFLNVATGIHTVTAKDANGCTKTIFATIGIAAPSTATAVVTTTACNTTNGSIKITGIGPNTPYHASISGLGGPWVTFDPDFTFTGLAPGVYQIIIADDESFDIGPPVDPGGCLDTIEVVVPSIGGPSIATTKVNGTCSSNNGVLTTTGSVGTLPYQYNINGGPYFASGVFNNLGPGIYILGVKDATGCENFRTDTLVNQPGPGVTAVIVDASCNLANATITATGSGGKGPLQYSIDGTTFQSNNAFNNLAAGNYLLYVADSLRCYGTISVNIAITPIPTVTAFSIAATCNINDGKIVASNSTGFGPFVYSMNGTLFQSNDTFGGLTAGAYTLYIKDSYGCQSSTGVSVGNISAPVILNTATTSASCGNPDGGITITATGGVAPLQYSINGIQFFSSNVFNGLASGNYTVTVKDAGGCLVTKTLLVGNLPGPQVLTYTSVNAACGLNNGTITASASGGSAPLNYSIDGTTYQASPVFNNVAAGSLLLYVKDAKGCLKSLPITLLDLTGPTLTLSASGTSCGQSDGTCTTNAIGGTGALLYSKNGSTFQSSNIFTGLAGGLYTINVKDARGCVKSSVITVNTIGTTVTPTFNPIAAICSGDVLAALPAISLNGITGSWSPALNNTATTTYTFAPGVGQCADASTLTITVNQKVTPTFNPVAAICSGDVLAALPTSSLNGIAGSWSPALNNTATTTYTFAPAVGQCANNTTLTISVNQKVSPTFNPVVPICSGDAIAALPTTSLNGITGSWSPALNNTATTTYTFAPVVGQCANSATLTITVSQKVTPTFNSVAAICSGDVLTALPTTSVNGITGSWTPALNNTATTIYTFAPTAGQCANTATLTITVNQKVTPTFNSVAAICSGDVLAALPTTSLNGITGSWSPALNNTATTTYTFTPTAGQCANTTALIITINPVQVPVINCGPSTSSEVIFSWAALSNANSYSVAYRINGGAVVNVGSIGNILMYKVQGLTAGDFVNMSVTPLGAAGSCMAIGSANCLAATCTPPTANISYNSPICKSNPASVPVTLTGTGSFSGGAYNAPQGLSINSSIGAINPTLSTPGKYTVTYTIAAAGGCPAVNATTSITINDLTTPSFSPVAAICSGETLNPLPTTSLNGITGSWSPVINNTLTTTYTFAAAQGQCANNASHTIVINALPATPVLSVIQPTCSISTSTINITSTIISLTFSLDKAPFISYPSIGFTGVGSGNHLVVAKNLQGCQSATVNAFVNAAPNPPTALATTVTNAACGSNNGTIKLGLVTGGAPPFSYAFDGGPFSSTVEYLNLAAGAHSVVVKDDNACTFIKSLTIDNSNGATVSTTVTPTSCALNNGIVTAAGTGGKTPYLFSIDGTNFQPSPIFNNLSAGSYILTIKDANNCIGSTNVPIASSAGVSVTANTLPASCGAATGSITINGSGGVLPYKYSIDGTNYQSGNRFDSLIGGSYIIILKDAKNCSASFAAVVPVNNSIAVVTTPDTAVCAGSLFQLKVVSTATSYKWFPATGLSNSSIANPIAAPTNTTTYIVTGTLGVCSVNDTITIKVYPPPLANAGADIKVCFGQPVQLQGSGGVSYLWSPSFNLSNNRVRNPNILSPAQGTYRYYLAVIDTNGCHSLITDTVLVTITPPVKVFAGNDTSIVVNQPLQLNAVDVNNNNLVNFLWSPFFGLSDSRIKNPVATVDRNVTYFLTASNSIGCSGNSQITITVFQKPDLFVPTAFTPNNDGLNDFAKVFPVGIKQLVNFSIYDRWGKLVFSTTNEKLGWDGMYKGQKQSTAAFVWVAEAIDYKGTRLFKKGTVVLIR